MICGSMRPLIGKTKLGPAYNEQKETVRYKWVLVVTKLFNMVVNDFDAKQSSRYSQVLVVNELVLSGTQCISIFPVPVYLTCKHNNKEDLTL